MIFFYDNAAADLHAGVTGGLCGKIIGRIVNDQRAADDFRQFDPVGIEDAVSIAFAAEKRRQIAGMIGVRQSAGIVMGPGLIKRKGAVTCFVDMQAVELTVGRNVFVGQPVNFYFDQYAAFRNLIKIRRSMQRGVIGAAGNLRISAWIGYHNGFPVLIEHYYKICEREKVVFTYKSPGTSEGKRRCQIFIMQIIINEAIIF